MGPAEVRSYVAGVRRRRRLLRRAGVAAAVAVVAVLVTGPRSWCEYHVAREGAVLPTLTGLTPDEGRDRLHRCLTLEVVGTRASDDRPGVILEQHPSLRTTGSKVVNDLRPIEVVLSTGRDGDDLGGR